MRRSFKAASLALALRLTVRPLLRRSDNVGLARKAMLRTSKWITNIPNGIRCEQVVFEGEERAFPALRLSPSRSSEGVIVHYHGGGYIAGSPQTHIALAAKLAKASGCAVLLPELPLAPEHPFPAAFETGIGFWHALRQAGFRANQIVIGGDSAGGGLALSVAAHLQQERPAAIYGFSPWCDLTFSGESMVENRRSDPLFPAERADFLAGLVLKGQAADDPRISPLFGRIENPAPLWLSVSSTEIIRDDALRMAQIWRQAGGKVTMTERAGLVHAWPFFAFLPESAEDIRALGKYLAPMLASDHSKV